MSFVGTYDKSVDKKGRVSIPAPFRNALGDQTRTIYIFPSVDLDRDCLVVWSEAQMNDLIRKMRRNFKSMSEQEQSTISLTVHGSRQVTIDENGRIQVPTDFMEEFGMTDAVTFVGDAFYFGIWQPETFQRYRSAMRKTGRVRNGHNVLMGMLSDNEGGPAPEGAGANIQGTGQ